LIKLVPVDTYFSVFLYPNDQPNIFQSLQVVSARVDIIPLFLDRPFNLHLDDDLEFSPSLDEYKKQNSRNSAAVVVQHKQAELLLKVQVSSRCLLYYANVIRSLEFKKKISTGM
jgi:hypothetical protein